MLISSILYTLVVWTHPHTHIAHSEPFDINHLQAPLHSDCVFVVHCVGFLYNGSELLAMENCFFCARLHSYRGTIRIDNIISPRWLHSIVWFSRTYTTNFCRFAGEWVCRIAVLSSGYTTSQFMKRDIGPRSKAICID